MRRNAVFVLTVVLWMALARAVLADGKVFREVFAEKIETPNQEALIHFADGIEQLVIETSLSGAGTNFAWVLPLPSAPEIKAVSEGFFGGLRKAFRSQLVHEVNPYYAGVLLVCGVLFLAWRSMNEAGSLVVDWPVCLAVGGLVWFVADSKFLGVLAIGLAFYARLFTRSPSNAALAALVAAAFAAFIVFSPGVHFGLVVMLGQADETEMEARGVTIVSVQRAGVFESTTIRGTNPRGVLDWLQSNGFETPAAAEAVIRDYVNRGWVFVASKVRRESAKAEFTALHPLAFTFATKTPVYPMRLTGIENGTCAVDLCVFGDRRAAARNFEVARCDRLKPADRNSMASGLRISDSEALDLIGAATVGTKLTAKLTPAQMNADVQIEWERFSAKGATVYSPHGAGMFALNLATPLAVLGWLLIGASSGGWQVEEKTIWRWRLGWVAAVVLTGVITFALLPKVEVVAVSRPIVGYGD